MPLIEKWRMGDPARVYERLEIMRNRPTRSEKAKQGLEALFKGDNVGRKLEIQGHIAAALYQWGDWARRPNFWANLRITPFCNLLGIGTSRPLREIELDPQSMAIHKEVLKMACPKTQAVLFAAYVSHVAWEEKQAVFLAIGVTKTHYSQYLKVGSLSVYNRAVRGEA